MLRVIIFFSIFLILIQSLCGCSYTASHPPVDEIRLGVLPVEDNMPFFVAEQADLFAKKGVRVTLVSFNSARERDIAIEAGELDGGLADILATAYLRKAGVPVKIVSLGLGATAQEGRFAILSAPKSGLTEPRQLRGIAVAISSNTITHYLAEAMLAESGLKPSEIVLQNIPDINIRLEALLYGKEIDAALLPDPLATLAETEGANIVIDDTKMAVNLSQTVILFREDTLQNRGEDIKKILAAYQEAAAELNQNPWKFRNLIIDKTRIPSSLQDTYSLPPYSPLQLPAEDMVERVICWMTGKGLLAHPFTYEELVGPDFLP